MKLAKTFLLAIIIILVGCFNEPAESTNQKADENTKKAVSRLSLSVPTAANRITIDEPMNTVISKDTASDSVFGVFEKIKINWGEFKKQNYSFQYYLYSTLNAIKIDSVFIEDSLTYINKHIVGNVITNQIGLTGDGIVPINVINDTSTVGGVKYKRFWHNDYDTSMKIVVYGTDTTTGLKTKLELEFAFKQDLKSIYCKNKFCTFSDSTLVYVADSIDYHARKGTILRIWDNYEKPTDTSVFSVDTLYSGQYDYQLIKSGFVKGTINLSYEIVRLGEYANYLVQINTKNDNEFFSYSAGGPFNVPSTDLKKQLDLFDSTHYIKYE